MKIGELAKRAGAGIDTVRFYEREGLLPRPQRQASGYRNYEPSAVARLSFIRRAKALGFTLSEIRELLELSGRRENDMAGLKVAATEKLTDVEAKLEQFGGIDGMQNSPGSAMACGR